MDNEPNTKIKNVLAMEPF